MNYDRIILELMDRVSALEEEVRELRNIVEDAKEQEDVVSRNTSFVPTGIRRDTTKYIVDGKRYGKNRMVLAVVKKYMAKHEDISAAKLMMTFDRSLQGSLGVIRTLEDVKNNYSDYERRFFCQPDEIIHTTTDDCVVCTQWGKNNVDNIIAHATNLGIEITVI